MADYKELGITPVINAAGTFTKYGGSLMCPEVLKAMEEASHFFIDVNELLEKTGNYIANLLDAEMALVTAGAAAGLAQAAAACIAGDDPEKIRALPDTDGMSNEIVVMRCHRNPYDQAMKGVGAKFVEIGNGIETHMWELKAAIGERTAAVAFFVQAEMLNSSLTLKEVLEVAHGENVPVIVDAAAELPPANNLWEFTQMGCDIVLFSGGKDIRGPQSSGLMLGKKELIAKARMHGPPRHNIGRSMKVDKETVMGFVRALEIYLEEDHQARMQRWKEQVDFITNRLKSSASLKVCSGYPTQPYCQPACIPRVYVQCNKKADLTEENLAEELMKGDPPIVVEIYSDSLIINPHMLQEGEEDVIVEKITNIIS